MLHLFSHLDSVQLLLKSLTILVLDVRKVTMSEFSVSSSLVFVFLILPKAKSWYSNYDRRLFIALPFPNMTVSQTFCMWSHWHTVGEFPIKDRHASLPFSTVLKSSLSNNNTSRALLINTCRTFTFSIMRTSVVYFTWISCTFIHKLL